MVGWEGRWVWGWVLGLWGPRPAGVTEEKPDEEGCALIGLGAEIWDIHRG